MKSTSQQRWISWTRLAGTGAALACAAMLVSAVITTQSAQAQTFTTLHSFDATDGQEPAAALVQATNGDFYGTTYLGGANDAGTIFKITPSGTLTTLYSFCSLSNCTDGKNPYAPLIQATNGDFYGTTYGGGANSGGTVFKITSGGTLTTLYSFCSQSGCTDGAYPTAGLVQAANGDLYGTTNGGGLDDSFFGTAYKITPSGTLTTIYSFCYGCGVQPWGTLVQVANGDFYGTAYQGGADSYGAVFKLTPTGTLTTLYSFPGTAGFGTNPQAGLVQATNGDFYGTTPYDGGNINPGGTIFQITPNGALTTLYTFCTQLPCTNWDPANALIQATDGNFYGTTFGGSGTVFQMTSSGVLTTLYGFDNNAASTGPSAGLLQATNGTFYGTTGGAGTSTACSGGCGTAFSLSVGLGPFVALQTTSGKEGALIGILGQGFGSSSVVNFGGTQATTITRTGTTFIRATVPAAALTGAVTVTTDATTLTSSQTFRVTPTIASFTPPSGPVGTPVTIMGTGLIQATKVTFNGKSAAITVNSDTQITATVPTGATTGKIIVTTPGGSAISATSFTVN